MEEQRSSIILGYDGSGWTSADIEAEIQSRTEPGRKVPLTMQLVGTPDIFSYTLPSGSSENALARVSLKSDATIPSDCKGTIEVIADPAMEAMMGMMQAMSPIAIPQIKLPKMRATVDVLLVPYYLEMRWNESVVSDSQTVELDGDGKCKGQLVAEVYEVNGHGQKVGEPLNAKFKVQSKWKEADWVELQDGSTAQAAKASITSKKLHLKNGPKEVGAVSVEVQIKGNTIRRHLNLVVNPLSVTLNEPKPNELKPTEQTILELVVTNSKGQGVEGIPVSWVLTPVLGGLSAATGSTDAQGRFRSTYTAPALEKLDGETTMTAEATVGPNKDWTGQVSLILLYELQVTVTFSKKGFTDVTRSYTMKAPGPLTVNCQFEGKSMPVAYVSASCGEITASSDSSGRISLALGETGTGHSGGSVSMQLSPFCQSWIDRIERELGLLTNRDWTTSYLNKSAAEAKTFAQQQYPKRLAEEPPESYDVTMLNIKLLASVVRVGDKARALLRRRYSRLSGEIEQFFVNLAGMIFALWGGKIMGKIADYVGPRIRKLFGWIASKLSKSDVITWLVKRGTGKLKGVIKSLEESLTSIKSKIGRNPTTDPLTQKISNKPGAGPFKHSPGDMVDHKHFRKLMEQAQAAARKAKHILGEARDAATKAAKTLKKLESDLAKAQANIATSQNPQTVAKWEKKIRDLGSEIGNASTNKAGKEQAVKLAEEGLEAAEKAAAGAGDLASRIGIFDELLAAIMGCMNRVYLLIQAGIARLVVLVVDLGNKAAQNVLKEWHPRMGDSISNMINDKIYKPLFQLAVGTPTGMGMAKVVELTLVWSQSNTMSTNLDASVRHCGQWREYEKETLHDALKYYFNEIDAASFRKEVDEVWMEYIADVLDWLEFTIVWGIRIANVIVTIVGVIAAPFTWGASLLALIGFKAGIAVATELFDTFWDVAKAFCRGLTSIDGLMEVAGIILPAHAAFCARLFSDESIYDDADKALRYSIGDRLDTEMRKLHGEIDPKFQAILDKVDRLEEKYPLVVGLPLDVAEFGADVATEGAKFMKETDVTSPARWAGGKVWDQAGPPLTQSGHAVWDATVGGGAP